MPNRKLEQEVISGADAVLRRYESADADAAYLLWEKLDRLLADRRDLLSAEVFDLVVQLEFLMKGDPEVGLGDLMQRLVATKALLD